MQHTQRRKILITGAYKGIAYATVERLVSETTPYDIILTSRDVKSAEKAIQTLQEKYPQSTSTLLAHQLDVNTAESIDRLASWVQNSIGKLDILINNAGVFYPSPSEEQKKLTIQTNYSSVARLTEKLLPFLTEDGKILNITSALGSLAIQGETLRTALSDSRLTEEKLNEIAEKVTDLVADYQPYGPAKEPIYPASKALLNAYTRSFLVKKVKKGQQVYAVHPGWVKTDMGGADAPGTVEESADTITYLINLPFEKNEELNAKMIGDNQKVMAY